MKKIHIPLTDSDKQDSPISSIVELMDLFPRHKLDNEPWLDYKSNCQTSFSIAHSGKAILLKYFVKEDIIKVAMHKTNDRVHKDNCVEFFISFPSGKEYYNLEINCMGVCSMAYGHNRKDRKILPEDLISKIKTAILISSASLSSATKFKWQITLVIPIEVFSYTNLTTLVGKTASGNFYKCGDDLPEPHYLTWSMIYSKSPDFHLPDFFGQLEFD